MILSIDNQRLNCFEIYRCKRLKNVSLHREVVADYATGLMKLALGVSYVHLSIVLFRTAG